ncbi:hypothetical protein [Microbacterium saperdae]|uniref:DUF5667 domain-containing protein n=1 Tax=Microbacterium saperdae TaxID=69368 RepID=A0A543BQN8_9MICO|nr:hypothetical protein [Microbacterium saperdae]TQL87145.1 hypothetical protein FB560_2812 [Microbacterium saperdae]GGM42563.1 hypothetical protein GCM10010489_12040 [Microbacterium saperdae]
MAFDEIFDLDKTRDRSLLRDPDATMLAGELDAVVGRRRRARVSAGAGQDVPRLVAMVEAAAADRVPATVSPEPGATRRAPRHIDWMTVIAGGLAVVAVAVASTLTAVQIATASPVGDALVLLESDEEALASAEQSLSFSRDRIEQQQETGQARAAALWTNLAALTPASEEMRFVGAEALAAVNAAAVTYQAALDAAVLPEALPAWKPTKTDEDSLASVATALDEVQERSVLVDAATVELRDVRTAVERADDEFTAALDTFAVALGSGLQAELDASPDPEQALRDAVQAASARATAADLTTQEGAAALRAYVDSVRALRADQLRIAVELEEESSQNGTWNPGTQTESPTPTDPTTPTNPGTGNPGTGNPGTGNPGPTDPGPTDPEPTDPEPTDPVG